MVSLAARSSAHLEGCAKVKDSHRRFLTTLIKRYLLCIRRALLKSKVFIYEEDLFWCIVTLYFHHRIKRYLVSSALLLVRI